MARFEGILSPSSEAVVKASPLTTASTAAISLGKNRIFSIVATGDCHIKFGDNSSMSAAAATDSYISGGVKEVYDTGSHYTHIRVYNPTGATIDVYVGFLAIN